MAPLQTLFARFRLIVRSGYVNYHRHKKEPRDTGFLSVLEKE
jgi:hypothetical protein